MDGGTVNNTFFYPALLCPANAKMKIYHEEQFGPVIPVVPYDDIETPIRYMMESKIPLLMKTRKSFALRLIPGIDILIKEKIDEVSF